ncbi:MAG: hypothetical protein ACFFCZ_14245 [Promethearchaeota archaeon]
MSGSQAEDFKAKKEELDALFLYIGILDAYAAVGVELIGSDVLEDHVLPKSVYYVQEFLPEIFSDKAKSEQLVSELRTFMTDFSQRIDKARERGSAAGFTMTEIWEIRAIIFGYESVFIDILGEAAIKNYVFKRIADILSSYLPGAFVAEETSLDKKLEAYVDYIQNKKFVGYAQYRLLEDNRVEITANRCAFAKIHDSDAYRNQNTRFCPWGMIGSAIVTSHEGKETSIDSCLFTTKGSISKLSTIS